MAAPCHSVTFFPILHEGFISGAGIPLQKQLEHANQQSGFTDAVRQTLGQLYDPNVHVSGRQIGCYCLTGCIKADASSCYPSLCFRPAAHPFHGGPNTDCKGDSLKHSTEFFAFRRRVETLSLTVVFSLPQSPFQSSPQGAPRHGFLAHSQTSQRFYPHSK